MASWIPNSLKQPLRRIYVQWSKEETSTKHGDKDTEMACVEWSDYSSLLQNIRDLLDNGLESQYTLHCVDGSETSTSLVIKNAATFNSLIPRIKHINTRVMEYIVIFVCRR